MSKNFKNIIHFKMLPLKNYLAIWFLYLISASMRTQGARLRYYRSSLGDYRETDLLDPLPLLEWIDFSKPTIFYAFGSSGNPDKDDVKLVTEAFIKVNHTNYILVNWEKEANNELLEPLLAHALTATPNSISIGKELGISLLQLSCNLDMSTVHLAGHSLGAHLVGYAGLTARERGLTVGRMTGLDPSSCKYEAYIRSKGLNTSSAEFVAIWHTDPGDFGTRHGRGDVDIWFNCDSAVQPGCPEDPYMYNYNDSRASCSHRHATYYFAESVLSPDSFIAVRASNCQSWLNGDILNTYKDNNILNVNVNINNSARGWYYLSTNDKEPYGRGFAGIRKT